MKKLFDKKHLAVIGAGNMGQAFLQGILNAGLVTGHRTVVTDVNAQALQAVKRSMKVLTDTDNARAVKDAAIVMLCVKPQMMEEVVAGLKDAANSKKLFVTIAAGIPCKKIEKLLGKVPVVRVMPNTPALIGEGMCGIAPGKYARPIDMKRAHALCSVVGKVVTVKEKQLDAVTGVSGSGPAYVYTFIEGLIEGGKKAGLSAADAETLAMQTVIGAAKLAQQSDETPGQLRNRVTSKGGTTLAGLKAMNIDKFKAVLHKTVKAATDRSKELGK